MCDKLIDLLSGLEIRWTDNTRKSGDPELPHQEPKPLTTDEIALVLMGSEVE